MKKYIFLLALMFIPCASNAMLRDTYKMVEKPSDQYVVKIKNDGQNTYKITILSQDHQKIGRIFYGNKNSEPTIGIVSHIFVEEKFRKQGVASLLLKKACELLKNNGCTILELEVAEENNIAQNFFKKHDFMYIPLDLDNDLLPGAVFVLHKKL